mmetsp:Transcript_31372/g.68590  ORF Transcript_31372/g.68590 Transcript_31372/m.68590 type:complete len:209 (-) Transcript_31372:584-1210(-)
MRGGQAASAARGVRPVRTAGGQDARRHRRPRRLRPRVAGVPQRGAGWGARAAGGADGGGGGGPRGGAAAPRAQAEGLFQDLPRALRALRGGLERHVPQPGGRAHRPARAPRAGPGPQVAPVHQPARRGQPHGPHRVQHDGHEERHEPVLQVSDRERPEAEDPHLLRRRGQRVRPCRHPGLDVRLQVPGEAELGAMEGGRPGGRLRHQV